MKRMLNTEQETIELGNVIGKLLFPGAFIALWGDLGAGKTTLVKGVAQALQIAYIQSPTFTIVREYETPCFKLCHFDAYRLGDADELFAIGFEDYLMQDAAIIMEWPGNVKDALLSNRLDIELFGSGNDARCAVFTAHGEKYAEFLDRIKEMLDK